MKPISHKEALSLVEKGLIDKDKLAAGIAAGIISPPVSDLRQYVRNRGERISILLRELKPFKPIEFSRSKADS